MICSLKVKCFQETGLKNIVKKNYLALVFFWGKKANIYFEKLEKHFEKCLAPQLITKIFAVSKNACIYVILNGAALHSQTLWLFVQCLLVGFSIHFLLLQKPHSFSFQVSSLSFFSVSLKLARWSYTKLERMQFCSHIHNCLSFYKHSWEQDLITWKLKKKNNCDYHKENWKYQQIYNFYIMKW